MKKLLFRVLVVLVVLLVIAVVAVGLFLDTAIKKGVETVGPKITQVDIKLDGVNLSLLSGSGTVKGLVVGNPPSYKTAQAIRVGKASVSVSPRSLLTDKIVVKSIRVEAPEITFEGGLSGNNLSKILDNVNAATSNGTSPNDPKAAQPGKPGKKLQVDDFLITGAKVHVSLTGLGGRETTVPLPDIHLTDLGKDAGGITPTDLAKRVSQELYAGVAKAVTGAVTDVGKGAVDSAKGAAKTATDAAGKTTKGITDLFKK